MDSYVYIITALLPLAAAMVVFQTNPYHALIIRGILGAIAALVYTVLGAADVALTEALVGTLLAITLYAVAVRSSLVLRLGVLQAETEATNNSQIPSFQEHLDQLQTVFSKRYMRVELVTFRERENLHRALLIDKEIHATCTRSPLPSQREPSSSSDAIFTTTTRLPRIYEILQTELPGDRSRLTTVAASSDSQEVHS